MPKTTSPLPIWLLLDKSGVTRHQIQTATEEDAIRLACRNLKRAIADGIPRGWALELADQPADQPADQQQTQAATRATAEDFPPGQCGQFTEGDTVRRTGVEAYQLPKGAEGTVTQADRDGVWVAWHRQHREVRYSRDGVGADGFSALELVKSVRPKPRAQATQPAQAAPSATPNDPAAQKLTDIRAIINTAKVYPSLNLIDAIETILNREPS